MSKPIVRISRAIIRNQDKILFLKQVKSRGGKFTLPGGKVSRKEDIKKTLVRELKEETGIVTHTDDLEMVGTQYLKRSQFSLAIHFFVVHKWQGDPVNNEPHKFSKLAWKTWPLNINKTTQAVKKALDQYLDPADDKNSRKTYF